MIRTANYSRLAQAIHHICANWSYFNHPYACGAITLQAPVAEPLLKLRDKQQYLRSLDRPEDPTEVDLAEDTEYQKDYPLPGAIFAIPEHTK